MSENSRSENEWPQNHELDPIMRDLKKILTDNGALDDFNNTVKEALKQNILQLMELDIYSLRAYVLFMNNLLKWKPVEHQDGKWIYDNLIVFYYVFSNAPLCNNRRVITQILPENAGKPQAPVTFWLVRYAVKVGQFLTTPESWTPETQKSFENAKEYNVENYKGPWFTFNDFFARHLKVPRTIPAPFDDHVVVSPADCTYSDGFIPIDKRSSITVKRLTWNIEELLEEGFKQGYQQATLSDNDDLSFAGGQFIHAFLAPFDYHRQHAPVSGKVVVAKVVQGQCYLSVTTETLPNGQTRLRPIRRVPLNLGIEEEEEKHRGSGGAIGIQANDDTGYQFLQTRGIIIIKNDNLGYVAVIPVGMAQVSSVNLSVKVGQVVTKGEEISWFELGGSDIIMVFQKQAKVQLTIDPREADHMYQGQQVIYSGYDQPEQAPRRTYPLRPLY